MVKLVKSVFASLIRSLHGPVAKAPQHRSAVLPLSALWLTSRTGVQAMHPWKGSVTTWYSRDIGDWDGEGYGAWLHLANPHPGALPSSASSRAGVTKTAPMQPACLWKVLGRLALSGMFCDGELEPGCHSAQQQEVHSSGLTTACAGGNMGHRRSCGFLL